MEKKITGVNIMQKVNGEIGVILEKSWDMGILWNKVGSYETIAELSQLIEEWYPWSVDEAELKELTEEFLENQYIDVDGEEIELIQRVGENQVYVKYRDYSAIDECDCLIYDKSKKNYLIGFSNTGWARIDGAIDLETGTVGYYNSIEDIYTPVGYLHDDDLDMLNGIIQDFDLSIDYECSVKRENKVVA